MVLQFKFYQYNRLRIYGMKNISPNLLVMCRARVDDHMDSCVILKLSSMWCGVMLLWTAWLELVRSLARQRTERLPFYKYSKSSTYKDSSYADS
jgi:hypothetical protein